VSVTPAISDGHFKGAPQYLYAGELATRPLSEEWARQSAVVQYSFVENQMSPSLDKWLLIQFSATQVRYNQTCYLGSFLPSCPDDLPSG
jgi:hypothetical protein